VVALISSRQGFLTPGSDASLHGLPNLDWRSVTLNLEAMQSPVHSGGNRLGISPNFPCRPQWAPATVQLDVTVETDRRQVEVAINGCAKNLSLVLRLFITLPHGKQASVLYDGLRKLGCGCAAGCGVRLRRGT
jgi:hypothetical protein